MNRNRKEWFDTLFLLHDITYKEMAKHMGIKPDSLYRKVIGTNGFNENDMKVILAKLNLKFENVFI